MPQRRFPTPWIAEEYDACFIVRDRTGLNLAYVYFQDYPVAVPQRNYSRAAKPGV